MSDKEFTDEEIIKALEDYIKENEFEYFHSNMVGEYPLIRKSLDLINRQKAEIESLKSANDEKFRQWDMLAEKKKQHYADSYNEAKDILKAGPIGFICRARLAIRSIKQIGSEKE